MKVKYGNRVIICDRVTETHGTLTLYQGGGAIMQMTNIPDISAITVEGGEIEHMPTELDEALERVTELEEELEALRPEEGEATEDDFLEALKEVGIIEENGAESSDGNIQDTNP